jgi:uncharacterized protein
MTNPDLAQPLSQAELDELDQFLMSEATSDECLMIDGLDGYMTAIVIGPVTLSPSQWLPGIWGPTDEHAPEYASMEQAQRILGQLLRHMNGIVGAFERNPAAFQPLVMFSKVKERKFMDGEGWAMGFMQAVEMFRADWQPLFDDAPMIEALRPIHLLGSENVTAEEENMARTPEQRESLAKQLPKALAAIHAFWLPYRQAIHERDMATTVRRVNPKVGRNDPCPCGSGKKFKKCCGQAAVLH